MEEQLITGAIFLLGVISLLKFVLSEAGDFWRWFKNWRNTL